MRCILDAIECRKMASSSFRRFWIRALRSLPKLTKAALVRDFRSAPARRAAYIRVCAVRSFFGTPQGANGANVGNGRGLAVPAYAFARPLAPGGVCARSGANARAEAGAFNDDKEVTP